MLASALARSGNKAIKRSQTGTPSRISCGTDEQASLQKRCLTTDGTRPRTETAVRVTRTATGTGTVTETETEGGVTDGDHRPCPPAVNGTDDRGATGRRAATCAPEAVVLLTGQQTIGPSSEDSANTGVWTRVESGTATERESRTQPLKVTILQTSARACTTTDAAGSARARTEEKTPTDGTIRTGGKAAGVSTNEGGVEPGPIAHRPR